MALAGAKASGCPVAAASAALAVEISPSNKEEGTPAEEDHQPVPYESNNEGESDLMVSGAIHPFSIPVTIVAHKLGAQGELEVLIDSGCTRCLMSMLMVLRLEIRLRIEEIAPIHEV